MGRVALNADWNALDDEDEEAGLKRVPCTPRPEWRSRLDERGFNFHSIDEHGEDQSARTDKFLYWREDVAYEFTEAQVECLYEATRELQAMSMALAGELIERGDLGRLKFIPESAQALIEQSWAHRDLHLYGRFDISWNGEGEPKLLEYNADTPTSIVESAVAQWWWKEEVRPEANQFNSLHEALVERLRHIATRRGVRTFHVACLYESQEDVGNAEYLLDVAVQAGLHASLVDMGELAVLPDGQYVDGEDRPVHACFKLYPWEWMAAEPLAAHLAERRTLWLEPPWKMVLSNKAMLALLWERHRGHPNLLPATFDPRALDGQAHVRKPLLSREGANVAFIDGGQTVLQTPGEYGDAGYVYQAFAPVASFPAPEDTSVHGPLPAMHAVLGTWVVGDEPAGLCVREDPSPVTKNTAYFVPHYFC